MSEKSFIDICARPFADAFRALDMKEQRRAARSAVAREARLALRETKAAITRSGLGKGASRPVTDGLRIRVYPPRYGLGYIVTTKPRNGKGFHLNRQGKEKPVLMWAAEGTVWRYTRQRFAEPTGVRKLFGLRGRRVSKSHATGAMPSYGFMPAAEARVAPGAGERMAAELEKNVYKRLRANGFT